MLRVLVDADNVTARRLQPVLTLLGAITDDVQLTASGRPQALARSAWPQGSVLLPHAGWQRADAALAEAYRPDDDPLILISGDGDFACWSSAIPGRCWW